MQISLEKSYEKVLNNMKLDKVIFYNCEKRISE